MQARAKRIDMAIDNLVKKVALTADQTVVLATPVDTGRARSNWITTINSPNSGTIDPYSPGDKLGIGETANAQAAMDQAKAVVATRMRGQSIHITNNLEYIGELNRGTSKQAPSNFVGKAVLAAVNAIRSTKVIKA
jgi:hypothetical protein